MKYHEIKKILNKNGYKLTRVLGSHNQFKKDNTISIVIKDYGLADLPVSALKDLEQKTGLSFR